MSEIFFISKVNFDLINLIIKKKDLVSYYEQDEIIFNEGTPGDNKRLWNLIDKYLFHTIEEVDEFYEAYNNLQPLQPEFNKRLTDTIEEGVDVINYLVSTLYIIERNKYNHSIHSKSLDFENYLSKFLPNSFQIQYDEDNDDIDFMGPIDQLIHLRRLFPERKWHKKHDRNLNSVEIDNLLSNCEYKLLAAIRIMFKNLYLLTINTDWDITRICNLIVEKHNRVVDARINVA